MNCTVDVISKKKTNKKKSVIVKDVKLLPATEFDNIPEDVLQLIGEDWWLGSKGHTPMDVKFVNSIDYIVDCAFMDEKKGIRPALSLKFKDGENAEIGSIVNFKGYDFTVISNNYALCNELIGKRYFTFDYGKPDGNEYKNSDVKEYIDNLFCKE